MKTKTIIVVVSATCMLGIGMWGVGVARRRADDDRKLRFVRQLVASGRPEEALSMIGARRHWPVGSKRHDAWLAVSVDVFEQTGNALGLGQVFYDSPHLLHRNESASLLAARALILKSDLNNFDRLRSQWRGREDHPHAWAILEADSLLRRGRRAQATALLAESPLEGRWEASRQVRLALLHASQPWDAWRHLSQAVEHDSNQAIARLFRAQLLEASGRYDEARLEYVAARLAQPENAALCDQLAEFYRRQGNYRLMLDTWMAAAGEAKADFIDLKVEFWSRVALPTPQHERQHPAHGPFEGLVRMLRELPADRYWDESLAPAFEGTHAVMDRTEVQWLRRLQMIQEGREREALRLLQTTPTVPWDGPLRRTLLMVLNLRAFGELDPNAELRSDASTPSETHPLLAALNEAHANDALAPELRRLLCSDHGLPLALMAHGWLKAAVTLSDGLIMPSEAPAWAAYGMTQAIRLTKGPDAGIHYAEQLLGRANSLPPRSPGEPEMHALRLLIGELYLERAVNLEGETEVTTAVDTALDRLRTVAFAPENVEHQAATKRANWLALVAMLECGRNQEAKAWLRQSPTFAATREGREIQARLALLDHDVDAATSIYADLQDVSTEAKVFFAKTAVHDKDWGRAKQLTLELLKEYPADQQLLRSLAEIERQQQLGSLGPASTEVVQ